MADMFPDEGLDVILAAVPKGGSFPATLYLGLFIGDSGTVVPAAGAVLASSMGGNFSEAAFTSYARQSLAAASWGAAGAKTAWSVTGRGVDYAQTSFPAAGAAYNPAHPIIGFFVADASTNGHAIYYSNFSDNSEIDTLALGDVVKVTPTFGFGN